MCIRDRNYTLTGDLQNNGQCQLSTLLCDQHKRLYYFDNKSAFKSKFLIHTYSATNIGRGTVLLCYTSVSTAEFMFTASCNTNDLISSVHPGILNNRLKRKTSIFRFSTHANALFDTYLTHFCANC